MGGGEYSQTKFHGGVGGGAKGGQGVKRKGSRRTDLSLNFQEQNLWEREQLMGVGALG